MHISKLTLIFVCLTTFGFIHSENIFGRWVKQWVSSSFGIDANEPLILEPFEPTIENLNTITLVPTHFVGENRTLSVAKLAHCIDTKAFDEQLYLELRIQDEISKIWHVEPGINLKQDDTIFVYSRGYAGAEHPEKPNEDGKRKQRGMCAIPKRGGSVVVGAQWLKNRIINGTCLMFDYPDTRSYFDFGLHNDRNCLDTIYNKLIEDTNNIVFFGNCRGSKALLNFLAHSQPEHVRAVILDAPFLDLVQFTQEIGKNYGKRIPFSKDIAYKVINYWHPNYRLENDLDVNDLKRIPKDIPIFIGHLYHDALVSNQLIKEIVKVLRDSGHTVYLLVIDDANKSHSRLYQTPPFVKAVNAFLKRHDLPHDATLAYEGRFLLNYASHTAKNIDNWHQEGFPYVYKNA